MTFALNLEVIWDHAESRDIGSGCFLIPFYRNIQEDIYRNIFNPAHA